MGRAGAPRLRPSVYFEISSVVFLARVFKNSDLTATAQQCVASTSTANEGRGHRLFDRFVKAAGEEEKASHSPKLSLFCLLTSLDQSVAEGFGYGFGFGMNLQFLVDTSHVECNRRDADAYLDRSGLIIVAFN